MTAYPTSCFVIVEIHERPALLVDATTHSVLSFSNVYKTLGKSINHRMCCRNSVQYFLKYRLCNTYLYPYSKLSPQPPQIQSFCRSLGRPAREQLHEDSWPSLQLRDTAYATPAAVIALTKADSRVPATSCLLNTVCTCGCNNVTHRTR